MFYCQHLELVHTFKARLEEAFQLCLQDIAQPRVNPLAFRFPIGAIRCDPSCPPVVTKLAVCTRHKQINTYKDHLFFFVEFDDTGQKGGFSFHQLLLCLFAGRLSSGLVLSASP